MFVVDMSLEAVRSSMVGSNDNIRQCLRLNYHHTLQVKRYWHSGLIFHQGSE